MFSFLLNYLYIMLASLIIMFSLTVSLRAIEIRKHQNFSANLAAFLLSGRIEEGDASKVAAIFKKYMDVPNRAAYLASHGGNLFEGIKLGLVFNSLRVKTVIEGKQICASACALAFFGGRDSRGNPWRSSSNDSLLGVHAFRNPRSKDMNSDDTQKIVALILRYGASVNAPMEIIIKKFQTSSEDMHWVSNADICRLGIKLWDNNLDRFTCNAD